MTTYTGPHYYYYISIYYCIIYESNSSLLVCSVTLWQFGGAAGFSATLAAMAASPDTEKPKEEISLDEVKTT